MKLTLEEILNATGAKIIKNETEISDKFTFSTDTRTITSGEIYLPLKGENFDGEKFFDKALESGAIGCFTTQKAFPASLFPFSLILEVDNTLSAYLEIARFYKRKVAPKTVVITGSSGKTTTKEMAFCVAQENFRTHKSELNFNNEIGLCKTILAMPDNTEVLILEAGMRGLGEIELISKYSEPDITIVANVGTAHIGRLGSKENIAKAKCEVTNFQKQDGTFIAHNDELIKDTTEFDGEKVFFSLDDAKILERKVGYSKFIYKNNNYELNIEGDYNVQNALSVIEMGLKLGMKEQDIASGLKKYSPIEKRWDIQDIKGFKIINDSYNANPDSMKAAIQTVLNIYEPPILLVLGDMGELGENEVQFHAEIGEFLISNLKTGVEVLTIGKLANEITKKLNEQGIESKNFENNLQTSCYILDNVKIGTTIILKASRSMKFEEILEKIKESP